MKLTTLILIAAILHVSATTLAQKVSLVAKNQPLNKVFEDISNQTGFDFAYTTSTLDGAKSVTINIKNEELNEVLKKIFNGQPLEYAIEDKSVVVSKKSAFVDKIKPSSAVLVSISGKVTDTVGIPLPGAIVKVIGQNTGVQTSSDGTFNINAQIGDRILVSFLGYGSYTFSVKENMPYQNIILHFSSSKLNEVVVTSGYQTILKERAAGSYDHINSDVLQKRPVSDISTALQGLSAGVQGKENADGTVSFLIRGISSIYSTPVAPLVIVDGYPIQNAAGINADFSSINPNDIESIDILKDATAASIWGARSANGVIVITTKHGKGSKGLTVNANVSSRISVVTDLNQYLLTANSSDMVKYERLGVQNSWVFAGGFYQGGSSFPNDVTAPLTLAQRLLYANKYGQISTAAMNKGLDSLSAIDNHDQINKYLMRRQSIQQYDVSLSDNTDRSTTYASLLFENNQSRYQGTGYERFDINLRNEYKITKFLTFNFGAFLQYTDQNISGATNTEIQALSPYETLVNPNGAYSTNVSSINDYAWSLLPTSKFPYPDQSYNLLREAQGRHLESQNFIARIQTGLLVKIVPGFNFNTSLQYERGKIDVNNYYSDNTFYVRNMVDTYVQYNNTTRTVGTAYLPTGGILQTNYTNTSDYVFRNQLNFDKSWGKNNITALAAAEITQNRTDLRTDPWLYGYNPTTLQATTPLYGYGSSANLLYKYTSTVANSTLSGGNTILSYNLNRYVSALANAAYTYDDKYTLTASIRSDASNYVTKISSLRWSPFWTIGAKWNASKEEFAKNWSWVDQLSLRATYGKRGNTVTSVSTNTLLSVGTSPSTATGTIVASVADNGNPTLRWEQTTTTNLGLDYSLFKGKLYGSLEAYNSVGKDITALISLAAATGTTSQKFNDAGIINRGLEITIGNRGQIGSTGIGYNSSLNFAYNYNRISNLYYPSTLAGALLDPPTTYLQGRPLNAVYSLIYKGMVNNVPTVLGPNSAILPVTNNAFLSGVGDSYLQYYGSATPPYTLGWRPGLSYKNFSLTAVFVGTFGGFYRNGIFNYGANVGGAKIAVNRYVADVFAGDPNVPGFPAANYTTTYLWGNAVSKLNTLVESSSYIQCKDILLDYMVTKTMLSHMHLKKVRLYVDAANLGLVWAANKNGYDPDWLPGTERPLALYTVGINVGF